MLKEDNQFVHMKSYIGDDDNVMSIKIARAGSKNFSSISLIKSCPENSDA